MRPPILYALTARLFACALAASLASTAAHAAWQPDGVPLSPMPPDFNTRYDLRGLLADGAGGAYVTWQYSLSIPQADQTNFALVAQRVDVLGNRPVPWTPAGSSILTWISSPGSSGVYSAQPVALVPDGAGGAIDALISQSLVVEPHANFNLHEVAPNATVSGFPGFTGDFAGGSPLETAVDGDGTGGVIQVALAQTFAPPPGPRGPSPLFARRISAAGAVLWGPVDLVPPGQGVGDLAARYDGELGGWFAWIDRRDPSDNDVYVQRLDDTGAPAPGFVAGGQLVCGAAGAQFEPHLVPDGAGGVVVVWRDERDGSSRLYASHVQPAGGIAPGIPADGQQIPSADDDDRFVNLAYDGQGGTYLVRAGATAGVGISHLHRLGAALLTHAGWPATGIALNSLSPGDGRVGLAADDFGGAYVSYRNGFGTTHPQGLYAQHFAGDGTLAAGWTAAGYRLSGTGQESKLVRSGAGAIVAWQDSRSGYPGVYAQRIVTDGPVATELSLVEATAATGRVMLHWFAADGAGLALTVERSDAESGWTALADVSADGTGNVRYEDTTITPGARYAYRVTWRDGDALRATTATWVTVPARLALAIESPRPNPSSHGVSLAVSLPDARPARLDVLDLAGRRVASRDLVGLGAGRHVVALGEIESLAAGLYIVQLSQAGEARRARLMRVN